MSVFSYRAAVVAALLSTAAALPVHAEDVPSNAELFKMLKVQQKMIGEQQKTISELRGELRQTRAERRPSVVEVQKPAVTASRPGAMPVREAMAAAPVYAKSPLLAPPAPNRFTVSGEFLWLRAGVGDTGYALLGSQVPGAGQSALASRINNDPDFSGAWRVGVGYEFGATNRAINLTYTHLGQSSVSQITGPMFAIGGSADLARDMGQAGFFGSATSRIDVGYDRIDLLASEPVKWSDARVTMLYGLEYAKINVNERIAYDRFPAGNVVFDLFGDVWNSSRTNGIGPQFGANVEYDLLRDSSYLPGVLSVNATSTGSLLYGMSRTLTSVNISAPGATPPIVLRDFIYVDDQTKHLIPAVHLRGGLTYAFPVLGWAASVSVGYEFNTYFGAVVRNAFIDDVSHSLVNRKFENFDASGPYANVKVKF